MDVKFPLLSTTNVVENMEPEIQPKIMKHQPLKNYIRKLKHSYYKII